MTAQASGDRGGAEAIRALAGQDGIPEKIDAVREACTALRWHGALRRKIPEAGAESRVRGAKASAELEGATFPVERVRDLMRGAVSLPIVRDPVEHVLAGAMGATAESEHIATMVTTAPLQALARLHLVAAAGMLPPTALGRPRLPGEQCREFVDLGAAPESAEARARLAGVARLLTLGVGSPDLPVAVVAAVVHAELVTARPFVAGNGLVARALERALVRTAGLDPTGVAVIEAGHGAGGGAAYLGGLAAYGRGDALGVRLWLGQWCDAAMAGARAGVLVADALRDGTLN